MVHKKIASGESVMGSAASGSATDVLIVGAGPVGLTTAAELIRRGVRVRVIDKEHVLAQETRAMVVHPRTLELFAQMGIADELVARSVKVRAVNGYRGDGRLFRLDTATMRGEPYPYMAFAPQYETERVLLGLLEELGGTVERGELVGFRQEEDGVVAEVEGPGGECEEVRARWLIGADGSHSRVRKALGVPFEGSALEEHFLLGDVDIDWGKEHDEVHLWMHPDGAFRVMPLPGSRRVRIMASVPDASSADAPRASLEVLQRFLRERTGDTATRLSSPTWLVNFTVSLRMVDRYRVGRVFLASDAAHINSFFGGRGMNTGVLDAHNLAWKLALVARGKAPDSLLDTYEEERLPVAKGVLRDTGRITRANLVRNPALWLARDLLARALDLRFVQRRIVREATLLGVYYRASSLSRSYGFGAGPEAGDRAPEGRLLHHPSRTETSLFEEFRGTHFTLLLFDGITRSAAGYADITRIARRVEALLGDEVRMRVVVGGDEVPKELAPSPDSILLDPGREAHAAYGADKEERLYLIRPDGHVGFCGHPSQEDRLLEYLGNIFVLDGGSVADDAGRRVGAAPRIRTAPEP